jgi:hypothetical protein
MKIDDMGQPYKTMDGIGELNETICRYPLTITLCVLVRMQGGSYDEVFLAHGIKDSNTIKLILHAVDASLKDSDVISEESSMSAYHYLIAGEMVNHQPIRFTQFFNKHPNYFMEFASQDGKVLKPPTMLPERMQRAWYNSAPKKFTLEQNLRTNNVLLHVFSDPTIRMTLEKPVQTRMLLNYIAHISPAAKTQIAKEDARQQQRQPLPDKKRKNGL